MQRALFRPSLQRFKNNLKQTSDNKNKNDKLEQTLNDINEKIKYILMKKYILRWADNNQKLADKTNDSASIIQRNYKGYKARKEKDRLLFAKGFDIGLYDFLHSSSSNDTRGAAPGLCQRPGRQQADEHCQAE